MITDDELMGMKRKNMDAPKELKVKLPVGQLIRLHALKITHRRNLSAMVEEALTDFFAVRLPAPRAPGIAGGEPSRRLAAPGPGPVLP